MSWRRRPVRAVLVSLAISGAVLGAIGGVAGMGMASCSATTTNNPLRSFQYAQKMDVVCLQVNGPDAGAPAGAILPVPQPQAQCAPDPINVNGFAQPFHLFALVTELVRGEVAVVDLTAGTVVDIDRSTPGYQFLPVGANPRDIKSTADGSMTYVSCAEPNKPALYALPSSRILGDSLTGPNGLAVSQLPQPPVPLLTTWPACELPRAPGPIAIVPTTSADGGAPTSGPGYVISVVLPGNGGSPDAAGSQPAIVLTIDPEPLMRGAGLDAGPGPEVAPGSLAPCPILGATELANDFPSPTPGPPWSDGVPYADAGPPPLPVAAATCPATDGGVALADTGPALPTPLSQATAAVIDGQMLYVADGALPVIHVIDLSTPSHPVERAPLLATNLASPGRLVSVGQLALSPPTRSYQKFLYAIDTTDTPASLMVFDVTDPLTSPHVPLTRPNPELNPFQPVDRLVFGSPVATLAFVRHDWPLIETPSGQVTGAAQSGVLCNPNPNAIAPGGTSSSGPFLDPGAYYTAAVTNQPEGITPTTLSLWPERLRGVFGFVTLSTGAVVVVDVDDWDAPCRRPDPMENDAGMPVAPNDIAPVEPTAASASDLNPYHAPNANPNTSNADPTSQESFFPVSAPHRTRSYYPLKNDVTAGPHQPYLTVAPQLTTEESATLSGVGPASAQNPLILPTSTTIADPYGQTIPGYNTNPNIRFAWEDPTVQMDQNWTVDYESEFNSQYYSTASFNIATPDKFQTLTLTAGSGLLCRTGVEDLDVGTQRAQEILAALSGNVGDAGADGGGTPSGFVTPDDLTGRLVDYIQLADNLLPYQPDGGIVDPYWSEPNTVATTLPDGGVVTESCWTNPDGTEVTNPQDRYNECLATFGTADEQQTSRDFPILQAYDDHFVIGRFYSPTAAKPPLPTGARPAGTLAQQKIDPANPTILKLVKCCFENVTSVNIRAGGEWVAVGSANGFLHHIITDPATGRCVQNCDPSQVLLNSRSVGLIAPSVDSTGARVLPPTLPDRNSPLAMRNPMFSYLTFNGTAVAGDGGTTVTEVVPARDDVWRFSTRGEFTPLEINIAATNTSVAPQSMFFVQSFGQLAVIDGSSQGLIMIDLNALDEAHTPYY